MAVEASQSPFRAYEAGTSGAREGTPRRPWGIADVPVAYDPPLSSPSDLIQVPNGTLELRFPNGDLAPSDTTDPTALISKYPCVQQGEPIRQLANIKKAPVFFITTEASVHALYNQCLVFYLQQAGVDVEWAKLAERGIRGNGHFSMLEKNSGEIARLIEGWFGESGLA